jgi:hypothetical protein
LIVNFNNIGVNLSISIFHKGLDSITETLPVTVATVVCVGRKNDTVKSWQEFLLELENIAHVQVKLHSLLVLVDNSRVHHVFIRLGNNGNQEVNQDNQN